MIKELWVFDGNRIAVRFAYEWHDDSGHWFRSYGNENWEFAENGCRLVTISTDNITDTNEFRTGVGAHWPFLSDPRRIIQTDLDIAEYTDPEHNPMIPHTVILEPGLIIYKIYVGYWFFGRPTVEDLRQDLRAVLKKCRPDWDITTPEMKTAWQEGRKELFYPYGKTFAETIREQD